jgi:hypothetical protein
MNSRRFNWSNCIRSPASQNRIAGYRNGEDQSAGIKHITQLYAGDARYRGHNASLQYKFKVFTVKSAASVRRSGAVMWTTRQP